MIPRILDYYGLDYMTIYPAQAGYRNQSHKVLLANGQLINVLVYKNELNILSKIKRANAVSDFLYAKGLPSRQTFDPKILCMQSPRGVRYVVLYSYLPGQTIAWEAYTKDHIKLAGKMMSNMHFALVGGPPLENKVTDEYRVILARMKVYFNDPLVQDAIEQKLRLVVDVKSLNRFELILRLADNLPNQQILHMDFVRGNLLFNESKNTNSRVIGSVEFTGILDFEKTAYGHPVFDIARTLAFLLVDCRYKSEQKIRKYFLVSGYNKRGSARFKNIHIRYHDKDFDVLEELVNLSLVYDFYKFLRHNPYEFLVHNQHFVRTRDILIRRNMIK